MATIESEKTAELEKRLKQELKEILSQMNYRSGDVSSVIDKVWALLIEANQQGITLANSIDDLLMTADEKVKEAVRKEIADREIVAQKQAEEERRLEEELEKAKLVTEALLAESIRLQNNHEIFKQEIDTYMHAKVKEHDKLDKIFEDYKQGKVDYNHPDEIRKLAELLKTDEQIKEDHEKKQRSYQHLVAANTHHSKAQLNLKGKEASLRQLEEGIALEQRTSPNTTSPALLNKIAQAKRLKEEIDNVDRPTVSKAAQIKQEANEKIEKIKQNDLEIAEKLAQFKESLNSARDKGQPPGPPGVLADIYEQQNKALRDGNISGINPQQTFLDMFLLQEGRSPKNFPHVPNDVTKECGDRQSQNTSTHPQDTANQIRRNLNVGVHVKRHEVSSVSKVATPTPRSGEQKGRDINI
ncbi:hypothetical protein [Candidatus Tisiphia endosymbiont of Nemotelus uliginosus]|uniref:hypothetical protein n=1 Tax=Candidatus Tisiphia endosymbiont of Nemotelus uliginosus TaxID=3077926 RepID=UPI0035C9058A